MISEMGSLSTVGNQFIFTAEKRCKFDLSATIANSTAGGADIYARLNGSILQRSKISSQNPGGYSNLSVNIILNPGDIISLECYIYGGSIVTDGFSMTVQPASHDVIVAIPEAQVAYIKDVKTSVAGGPSIAGTQVREINTLEGDTSFVTIDPVLDRFTIQAGEYEIDASCPAFKSLEHQCYIYNADLSTYDIVGTSEYANGVDGGNRCFVSGELSLSQPTTFELRHWTRQAQGGNGLGVTSGAQGTNPQTLDVYAMIKIRKLR